MTVDPVVVRIFGGLGNQLFMYACGQAVARSSGRSSPHHVGRRGGEQYRPFSLDRFTIIAAPADDATVPRPRGFGEGRPAQEWYHVRRSIGLACDAPLVDHNDVREPEDGRQQPSCRHRRFDPDLSLRVSIT